jgi:hypothetical protein
MLTTSSHWNWNRGYHRYSLNPSYLDLQLEIDSEGRLRTKLYDKRDDFNFPIVNFPFIYSNISAAPAYGVYISQLIRYFRAYGSYQDFLDRELLLTRKLLNQGWLSWSHHFEHFESFTDMINHSQTTMDMFNLS